MRIPPWKKKNAAFSNRVKWLRGIVYQYGYPPVNVSPYTKGINDFITQWPDVGILIQKEGIGDSNFPDKMWVENGRTIEEDQVVSDEMLMAGSEQEKNCPKILVTYGWLERAEKRKRG